MISLKKTSMGICIAAMLMGSASALGASSPNGVVVGQEDQILSEVTTYAGIGDFGEANGDALLSSFRSPMGIFALIDGSVLISDTSSQLIRKITNGKVSTYAGITLAKDNLGFPIGGLIDGDLLRSLFQGPVGITIDRKGGIFVADAENHAIRKIDTDGKVTTVAGNGLFGVQDGQGAEASFNYPQDVAVAEDGTLYVADTLNHAIRKVDTDGNVTTLNAPSLRTIEVVEGQVEFVGDYKDGSISEAKFNEPSALAIDNKGNLYVSDTGNQRIRYIDLQTGMVTTVAGASTAVDMPSLYESNTLYAPAGYTDGAANQALFNFPRGITLTEEGGLVIADSLNHAVRYLYNGKVTTLAGDPRGFNGELDGVDRYAQLHNPTDVSVMKDGSILVADSYNNKIRKITFYELPDFPQHHSIKVAYGQKVIAYDSQPEMSNGRAMVPIRKTIEALGYEVKFTTGGSTIQLIKGNMTLEIYVNKKEIKRKQTGADDIVKQTDTAPYIKGTKTYVPIRFFAEELGLDVQWIQANQTVILRERSAPR